MPEEMTNQSIESTETTVTEPTTTDDDGSNLLFDDEEDTPIDSADEDVANPETEEQETKPTTDTETFLKIKYNGADHELTEQQAIELAQKGMNYDKVYERMQKVENSSEMATLRRLAKQTGQDVPTYLSNLESFVSKTTVSNIAQQLKQKYPEAPDELLSQMAMEQYEKITSKQQLEEQSAVISAEERRKNELIQQMDALEKEYPDVDVTNLPADVIELVNNQGFTLLAAYKAHELQEIKEENERLQTELEAAKLNKANAEKATGSVQKTMKDEELDPILAGFMGK